MIFRSIFSYWSNTTDTPSIQSKLNIFFYINIRIFKIKLNNYILFAINGLNTLKYKQIKIFYNLFSFEFLYYKFMVFFLFLYFLLVLI